MTNIKSFNASFLKTSISELTQCYAEPFNYIRLSLMTNEVHDAWIEPCTSRLLRRVQTGLPMQLAAKKKKNNSHVFNHILKYNVYCTGLH